MTVKHGKRYSQEYNSWINMRQRCLNPKHPMFAYYGERGITICESWNSFENFFKDMGPSNGLTLDRMDNDKNYSASNCRWASRKQQSDNRRFCIEITFQNQTKNLTGWAKELGIPKGTLYKRYKSGWPIERMFAK